MLAWTARRLPCVRRTVGYRSESHNDPPSGRVHLHFVYNKQMASADTTTVRVRRPDSERLHVLAKSRQTPVIDVLHAALDALERQEFLRGLGQDYQRLREDPERWEQYLAERQEWDTLA